LGAEFFFPLCGRSVGSICHESETRLATFWDALIESASGRPSGAEKTGRSLIELCISNCSGGAHLAALDGTSPVNAKAWVGEWTSPDGAPWGARVGGLKAMTPTRSCASYKAAAALVVMAPGILYRRQPETTISERGFLSNRKGTRP